MIFQSTKQLISSACLIVSSLLVVHAASAEVLKPDETTDPLLVEVAEALDAYGIDVLENLNDRQLARNRSFQPRLGKFPDLPINRYPLSAEIALWEDAYQAGDIGGLAILQSNDEAKFSGTDELSNSDFWQAWAEASSDDRVFVSYASSELELANHIANVVSAYGHQVLVFNGEQESGIPGKFYATGSNRLALDSRNARGLDTSVTEFSYLGERVRRNSASIFRDGSGDRSIARQEPPVFLKESLGDEFSESTVREIIVPGGVALGETADLSVPMSQLRFVNEKLEFIDEAGSAWSLPDINAADAKALFDFASRSHRIQSDSIVDIDGEGRVKITSSLRDTDIGYQIMHADTLPFEYVRNLSVTKSVIIDTGVDWVESAGNTLQFVTDFEVRFLSADNMRLAQTRVALEYEFESDTEVATYRDKWGRDRERLRENMDYDGLGMEMAPVAAAAGWVGLLRLVLEEDIPFIEGRYEFMRLDKTGQETPARY